MNLSLTSTTKRIRLIEETRLTANIESNLPGPKGFSPPESRYNFSVPFIRDATASIAISNMPVAYRFLQGISNQKCSIVPIINMTQVRLVAFPTVSTLISGATIKLIYITGIPSTLPTYSSWLDLADTGICGISNITANVIADSGWVNLPSGLSGDIAINLAEGGGDAVGDATILTITAYFR